VRLLVQNVGGARPGFSEMATMGSAMKMLATTFGEWEEFADDWYASKSKSKSKSKAGRQAGRQADRQATLLYCALLDKKYADTGWDPPRANLPLSLLLLLHARTGSRCTWSGVTSPTTR
jgi:hypothetical protein